MFHVPEKMRVTEGALASDESHGNNGAFVIRVPGGRRANAIASSGLGWQHVSVSFQTRCPTWGEMAQVKDIFWDPEDCVVQYHPPASGYVNEHPHCLHLWRPIGVELPLPPVECV